MTKTVDEWSASKCYGDPSITRKCVGMLSAPEQKRVYKYYFWGTEWSIKKAECREIVMDHYAKDAIYKYTVASHYNQYTKGKNQKKADIETACITAIYNSEVSQ